MIRQANPAKLSIALAAVVSLVIGTSAIGRQDLARPIPQPTFWQPPSITRGRLSEKTTPLGFFQTVQMCL